MPLPDGKQTYYEFLGLQNYEADHLKIKGAYRTMALKWHPDRCDNKEEATHMMKQINVVYQTLSESKDQYDQHLRRKMRGQEKWQYQKCGRSPESDPFEDQEFSFTFTDIPRSGFYSTTGTRAASAELRRKLRIKKLMDTLSEEELTMVENFLALVRLQEKRGK